MATINKYAEQPTTHAHTQTHANTFIYDNNDYVATIFEASHSAWPPSSFISINCCFWCIYYCYCCLPRYFQLWPCCTFIFFIFFFVFKFPFVYSQESTWKFTTICEFIYYQHLWNVNRRGGEKNYDMYTVG